MLKSSKKYDKRRLMALAFFLCYLMIGLRLVGQYRNGVDAWIERNSSLVTYKYINETLFDRKPSSEFEKLPNLSDYRDRWYGMAMQIPMVIIEDVYDFKLTKRTVFLMRHHIIFLYCFIGYLCFYFMLCRLFPKNSWLPLIGVAFIALYPRFFPLQFVDVKNLVFNALVMATCYFMLLAVEKKRIVYDVLFGVVAALATNQRVMGVLFICTLIGYYAITDIIVHFSEKEQSCGTKKYHILKYPAVILSFFLFWTLITPLSWKSPIQTFFDTFHAFSVFYGWDGTMVFMGSVINRAEMPWYYLPVWMSITIPIVILVLFAIGHVRYVIDIVKSKGRVSAVLGEQKWLTCSLFLFWAIFFNIVLRQGPIYIGWHHAYFAIIPMVVVALFGLEYLFDKIDRRVVYAIVGVYFVVQCVWMVRHHPYQNVYFNIIGMQYGDQFDRDEERLVALPMVRWILAQEDKRVPIAETWHIKDWWKILEQDDNPIPVVEEDMFAMSKLMLTKQEKALISDEWPPKYIIEYYRNVIGNDVRYEGYEEVHKVWMGKFKIGSVYRLIE